MSTGSEKHRTTIAHFLNHGRWDDAVLDQILKAQVVRVIYEEAGLINEVCKCFF